MPRHRAPAALSPAAERARRGGRRARRRAVAGSPPSSRRDYIVEVEGLTKVFKVRGQQGGLRAVQDVSFAIPRGETVAIVGESGSGKTTTARMMLKVVEPDRRTIRFDGEDVAGPQGQASSARSASGCSRSSRTRTRR